MIMPRLKLGLALAGALSVTIFCIAVWNSNSQNAQRTVKDTEGSTKADKQYMQFDDWLQGKFSGKSFYPNWISDTEYVYRQSSGAIVRKNVSSAEESDFLAASAWKNLTNPSSYYISADLQYVAITYETTDGYAHYVRTFSVAVFDAATSGRVSLSGFPDEKIQKIKWDPVEHKMAYVYNFDVYVVTSFTENPTRITNDGQENVIFNGITDWLHYVEITNDDALLWWSPTGKYLAYASLDQTGVDNFDFALFGGTIYPTMISFPYPKPGTKIPVAKTFIFDTTNLTSAAVESAPSNTVTGWGDYYLNSAIWRSDSVFSPTWKNRFENKAVTESCTEDTWTCSHVSEMESMSTTGWLGHYKPADLVAMPEEKEYMTVLSNDIGFPHLVVVDVDTNLKSWRTNGTFEVTDTGSGDQPIFFYDEVNEWVYFTSTEKFDNSSDGLSRIRHLWRVKARGVANTSRECISCGLNDAYPGRCNWVRPSFSPGGSYVVINCGGTGNGAPISTIHKISADGTVGPSEVVENNDNLLTNLDAYYFRTREYGSITLPGVEGEYYYTLHKPPNFDESKEYPMLVQVYSGPGSQEVVDRFAVGWKDFVASSLDVVVMSFDGRGTGFRGDKIMHEVYTKLGQYEPADQIAAAKKLATDNAFIDATKTAIWGWSYGGYATTKTVSEDSEGVFKCGYAVAPVTDWLSYHTIYTERYMKKPTDNQENYNKSTTMQKYENFKNHQYFLFHGTADENVHFQNSARLSKALIEHDVDFGAFFAADDDHGMSKVPNNYRNLMKMITRQMCRCFDLDKPNTGVVCGKTSEERKKQLRRKK